jgi:hypothetical protein
VAETRDNVGKFGISRGLGWRGSRNGGRLAKGEGTESLASCLLRLASILVIFDSCCGFLYEPRLPTKENDVSVWLKMRNNHAVGQRLFAQYSDDFSFMAHLSFGDYSERFDC